MNKPRLKIGIRSSEYQLREDPEPGREMMTIDGVDKIIWCGTELWQHLVAHQDSAMATITRILRKRIRVCEPFCVPDHWPLFAVVGGGVFAMAPNGQILAGAIASEQHGAGLG